MPYSGLEAFCPAGFENRMWGDHIKGMHIRRAASGHLGGSTPEKRKKYLKYRSVLEDGKLLK